MKRRELLYTIGRPFSPFYSLLMRLRESLYRIGIFRVTRLQVPVVSVGNLTMGGSGKTPVVQYIARYLLDNGWHPAVISRGYGGAGKNRVNVVSEGNRVLLGAEVAGDEPRFLAETLQGVPVLTGIKRKYPAARAVQMGSDALVLDDGFQHMAMGRDLDLVLFNADFLAGNSRVFPGGDLREPVKALNRCHAFVITGVCQRNRARADQFGDLLRKHFPNHPVYQATYRPVAVRLKDAGGVMHTRPLDEIMDMKLFGFSGIAHPHQFKETLADAGLAVVGYRSFEDHFRYTDGVVDELFLQAKDLGAEGCITTEKDMVKLSPPDDSLPLYALQMSVKFGNDFNEFLLSVIRK